MLKLTRDKAIGAYIGMAVGDAYGAPFEFIDKETLAGYAEEAGFKADPVYWSGGAHNTQEGEWTDDTAMARCIANSYLAHDELHRDTVMHNFLDWKEGGVFGTRDYCFDIGGTCARAITGWSTGIPRPQIEGRTGEGNGGLMRLAPVVTFNAHNFKQAQIDAVESSCYTHDNDICALYAECLVDVCFRPNDLKDIVGYNVGDRDGSGHVEETFWNAVACVAETDNFMDAIHMAVMMGGDTDTTAAVAGTIAGAKYGLSGIPDVLVKSLHKSEVLIAEARTMYESGVKKANLIN